MMVWLLQVKSNGESRQWRCCYFGPSKQRLFTRYRDTRKKRREAEDSWRSEEEISLLEQLCETFRKKKRERERERERKKISKFERWKWNSSRLDRSSVRHQVALSERLASVAPPYWRLKWRRTHRRCRRRRRSSFRLSSRRSLVPIVRALPFPWDAFGLPPIGIQLIHFLFYFCSFPSFFLLYFTLFYFILLASPLFYKYLSSMFTLFIGWWSKSIGWSLIQRYRRRAVHMTWISISSPIRSTILFIISLILNHSLCNTFPQFKFSVYQNYGRVNSDWLGWRLHW